MPKIWQLTTAHSSSSSAPLQIGCVPASSSAMTAVARSTTEVTVSTPRVTPAGSVASSAQTDG